MDKEKRIKLIRIIREYLHKFASDTELSKIADICRIPNNKR
jgi:hypothetical protein